MPNGLVATLALRLEWLVERLVAVDSALLNDSNGDVNAQDEASDDHRCPND